jgi:hypothetical protein
VNEPLATFFERMAAQEPAQRLLCRMGLDPEQFVLFLRLFRTLSERGEWMGAIGVNRFQISYLALYSAASLAIPWFLMLGSPASLFLMLDLLLVSALTFLTIIREAAQALFNPVEVSMLAHKPVHSTTYAAAKIAHVIIAVLYLVSGLSMVPALIGIGTKGARWFWVTTHLSSAFLIGLWTAFMICALYGWIRRFVPAHWIKSISTWIQMLSLVAFIAIPIYFKVPFMKLLFAGSNPGPWTWLPLTWFVEIGLMGRSGAVWRLGWEGLLSIAASIIFIWFGLRSFSSGYFMDSPSIVEGGAWRNRKKSFLSRGFLAAVRLVTGSPLGLGSYCFISKMIRRDWQFRRAILTQAWPPFVIILAAILVLVHTGELPSPVGHESFAHILPHFIGLIVVAMCLNIPFTDFHNVSWIYLTTPIDNLRPFARGVYGALWVPTIAIPHLVLLPLLVHCWGWREALLSCGFNLIVVSLYLGIGITFISGLPFSSRVDESRAVLNVVYVQTCWIMATAFPAAAQWGLFQDIRVALILGIVLMAVTVFVVHWALGDLEGEMRWRMHILKTGPNQLFRSFE